MSFNQRGLVDIGFEEEGNYENAIAALNRLRHREFKPHP